jgi:error-prone DNA polymerase
MGFDNPPIPWRELERLLSWRAGDHDHPTGLEPDPDGVRGPGREAGRAGATSLVTRLPTPTPEGTFPATGPPWAELHCHSSYSFLDGASSPADLVCEAAALGLTALAITDHDGMYGVPQFAQAAARLRSATGLSLGTVFGAELSLDLAPGRGATGRAGTVRAGTGRAGTGRAGTVRAGTVRAGTVRAVRAGTVRAVRAGTGRAGTGRAARDVRSGVVRSGTPRAGVPDPAGRHLLILARDPEGYRRLCRVISAAQLAGGEKGLPIYDEPALADAHDGHWVILTGCRKGAVQAALAANGPAAAGRELARLTNAFGRENVRVELSVGSYPAIDERNDALAALAAEAGVATIATGNVHHATPADARLAQALAAIRARSSLDDMDGWLAAAGDGFLRSGSEAAARLRCYPDAAQRTADLAAECAFDFHVIAPKLPDFPVPPGHDEASWLRELVRQKVPGRYGPPDRERIEGAYDQIARELAVIEQLGFPGYFLIVHEIVEFCEHEGILCQGRGSAANSAVCYALGITSVDPVRHGLLFERFLSAGRDGPPDIDLDIEHRRREEVIQHVYAKYGRDKAAQVANVISYRPRMAIRDAGRALGYQPEQLDQWSKQVGPRQYGPGQAVPPDAGVPDAVVDLAAKMQRLPRHLGIHSGGMVICDRPVGEVCPVEWARMPNRSVLQWDKDDCAYAGLVKFDLLGLGMLTALRDCFDLVEQAHGVRWNLASIPQEDPGVYTMLQRADTVGVFQVESRAQMATLPRLRPEKFYDLVVEVALIRPGPIQGGSVHPYMRRRHGDEEARLPHELMRHALDKTLGVPLFQEQMMQIAIDCAGFSPTEADRLRQAMSSKRAPERIEELRERLLAGMAGRDIPLDVAEDIYVKILAFSSYGFPESHAISFAYLVYASAWLKCYYPAAFTAALLRAQPMGFYAPASLIGDVRRHGVTVRGADVNASGVLATLEKTEDPHTGNEAVPPGSPPAGGVPAHGQPVIRLGLSEVRNLGTSLAEEIVAGQPYADLEDFARRTTVSVAAMEALALGGAFGCFGVSRREALWAAGAAATIRPGQLPGTTLGMTAPPLPPMTAAEETFADLWATGTYGTHPIEHIRPMLTERGVLPADRLIAAENGRNVVVGGLVTHRQQPGTARGVVFLSLEDETGMANIICPPEVWQRFRKIGVDASALLINGRVERLDGAVSLLATRLERLRVVAAARSRDFR